MLAMSTNQSVTGNSPAIREDSYKEIFIHVNFKFSLFPTLRSRRQVGHPKLPAHALFTVVVLKDLTLNSGFRTAEAWLKQASQIDFVEVLSIASLGDIIN
ncbi:MAG: hypothetical protein ACTSRL_21025 [Candidatus Helarchaeota archaeon]